MPASFLDRPKADSSSGNPQDVGISPTRAMGNGANIALPCRHAGWEAQKAAHLSVHTQQLSQLPHQAVENKCPRSQSK
jgi:hypothetical protein